MHLYKSGSSLPNITYDQETNQIYDLYSYKILPEIDPITGKNFKSSAEILEVLLNDL